MSDYPSQELNVLRKSGQADAAYRRGQELLRQHPDDLYLKRIFGWVLYDRVKQSVASISNDDSNAGDAHGQIRSLFHEYARLRLDRPDLLFSRLVWVVLQLSNLPPFFPRFLSWAGVESFSEEDFQVSNGAGSGKAYPSLIERVANSIGKLVASSNEYDRPTRNFALELIDTAMNKGQVREPVWLWYRKGQLLRQLGEQKQARENLQRVVKKKPGEFWAWHELAKCEDSNSPSTALAYCSKAYLVAGDKSFAVGVLNDMVPLALNSGQAEFAKWAVDTQVSIRQSSQWRLPDSIAAWTSAEWYQDAADTKDPKKVLERYAVSAESLLLEGTWCRASLLEFFTGKNDKKWIKVVYQAGKDGVVGVVPANRCPTTVGLRPGAPLYAAIDSGQERNPVMALKARNEGEPFDSLAEVYGILDHQNEQKGLASIFLTPSDFCLLRYKDFEEVREWAAGSPVFLKCAREKEGRYRAYKVRRGHFRESEWIKRETETLRVHEKGFGFVKDVFVPPRLVRAELSGVRVTIVALLKPKGRGESRELGWQAVSMKRATSNSREIAN